MVLLNTEDIRLNQLKPNLVLLTGVTGFIGAEMLLFLRRRGVSVLSCSRSQHKTTTHFSIDINAEAKWSERLNGVDCILHLAGVAHKKIDVDHLDIFRQVNVEGTINLARQAAKSGVKRFVFLSSIGVNGDQTLGVGFNELDKPAPKSLYAQSKFEAEQALWALAKTSSMEIVIIRAPLVYGDHAPGNLSKLAYALKRRWPLPFAGIIGNKRSIVSIQNLVDFLWLCMSHTKAANQLFLVCDSQPISTAALLKKMSSNMGCGGVIFYFPPAILNIVMHICGFGKLASKLIGNLEVDRTKAKEILGWEPKC
jgi:nucleoside-diphosphate-sugar epimerase